MGAAAAVIDDVRFRAPLLTAQAAGVHLGIPHNTIRTWLQSPAGPAPVVHSVVSQTPRGPRLPFIALAEAQILRELRTAGGLSMQEIRASVTQLRKDTGQEYVLATRDIASDGGSLLYNAASRAAPEWVQARDRQGTLRAVIEVLLRYVHYAEDGFADRLRLRPYGDVEVIIDPDFGFGQPVLADSKIRVETIADLFYGGGESVEVIADEFNITAKTVETVIRVLRRAT